jgi:chemotaxis signal transduction protein
MEKLNGENAAILEKRATSLARPLEQAESRDEWTNLLVFTMMGKRYAVALTHVIAVTRIHEITSIPSAPKHIPGVIRRRGESIGLVNLALFFNSERAGISDSDFAVIVQARNKRFALQVEDILGANVVRNADLAAPQDNFDPAQLPFVSNVMLDGLVVLDLDALIQAKGFVAEKSV